VGAEGELRARVKAPAVGGAANAALIRLLATALSTPSSAVSIQRGVRARLKTIAVEGVTLAELEQRWPGLQTGDR